ncbi:MAG: ATP-binding protein, partial [Clostridia bacterium]|nr:ATP-binding protein [Clostridia bacterium]
ASAQQIFHRLEKEHFGRADGDIESVLTGCDLLVLDDLGTEMTTSFTTACLYNIINLRMLAERPTVISTNLTAADWPARYGPALASRVLGTFQPLWFIGADIRQAKMARRLQE